MKKLIALAVCALFTGQAFAQSHNLQLDDGLGHYSLITAPNPGGTYPLPAGGGTILVSSAPGVSTAWLLGGNLSSSPNNQIGTLDNTNFNFVTNGVGNVRMTLTSGGLFNVNVPTTINTSGTSTSPALSAIGTYSTQRVSALFTDATNSTVLVGHPSAGIGAFGTFNGQDLRLGSFVNNPPTSFTPILTLQTTNNFVGIGQTNPATLLSNVPSGINIFGAATTDGIVAQSLSWVINSNGYVAAFWNADGSASSRNGVAVKIANNSSGSVAFDVSQGATASPSGTALFNVRGNGDVHMTEVVGNATIGRSTAATSTTINSPVVSMPNLPSAASLSNVLMLNSGNLTVSSLSVASVSASGTTNTVPKFTGTSSIGNSLLTDDGTTLNYNSGKFTVASATGNTATAGSLTVGNLTSNGVVHATGGTGLLASSLIVNGDLTSTTYSNITGIGSQSQALNMNSHLINNVTDPASAQDAATKNYVDTKVNGAVSGTTNTVPKFTGANAIGNSSITDNGTTVATSEAFSFTGGGTITGATNINNSGTAATVIGNNGGGNISMTTKTTGFIQATIPAFDMTGTTPGWFEVNNLVTNTGGNITKIAQKINSTGVLTQGSNTGLFVTVTGGWAANKGIGFSVANAGNGSQSNWDLVGTAGWNITNAGAATFASGTINGALDMTSHKINNVTDPTAAQDAATKNYVDTKIGSAAWTLTGNTGTTAGTNFIGTTDNTPFEIHVYDGDATPNQGDKRVMRFEPNASGANIIGGYSTNSVAGGVVVATIAGGGSNGNANTIASNFSTIGGGANNVIGTLSINSTIAGGVSNAVTGSAGNGTISGGLNNVITSGDHTTISGGFNNQIHTGSFGSTIGGGTNNEIASHTSVVSGGDHNTIGTSAQFSTIGGGHTNSIGNNASEATIAGGQLNVIDVSAARSAIAGGRGLTLSGSGSFGFLGANTGSNDMSVAATNTSVFGNTDLWLANNDNAARSLYFYAPNNTTGAFPGTTKYVGFKAGAVGTSVIWTLPTADATSAGQALTSDAAGVLSWTSIPTGSGTTNTVPKFTSATAIGNSSISDDGTTVTTTGNLTLSGANKTLTFTGNGTGTSTLAAGTQGSTTYNYTLPTTTPSANDVLTATAVSGSGPYNVTLGWSTPSSGGGTTSIVKVKTSDQTVTNSTTMTNDAALSATISAAGTYFIQGMFITETNDNAPDMAIDFTYSGTSSDFNVGGIENGGNGANNEQSAKPAAYNWTALSTAVTYDVNANLTSNVSYAGYITVSTGGTFTVRFANKTAAGVGKSCTMHKGSTLVLIQQ